MIRVLRGQILFSLLFTKSLCCHSLSSPGLLLPGPLHHFPSSERVYAFWGLFWALFFYSYSSCFIIVFYSCSCYSCSVSWWSPCLRTANDGGRIWDWSGWSCRMPLAQSSAQSCWEWCHDMASQSALSLYAWISLPPVTAVLGIPPSAFFRWSVSNRVTHWVHCFLSYF